MVLADNSSSPLRIAYDEKQFDSEIEEYREKYNNVEKVHSAIISTILGKY